MRQTDNNIFYQTGVTMIEAMVALLLFSVGALGLVAMQYAAATGSGDNQQRTVAIWKAQELVNRIKANPSQITAYINRINNDTLDTFGDDTAAGVITCEAGNYTTPATRCADFVASNSTDDTVTNGDTCTDAEKVAFDVWEVFCEPSSGAAVTGTTAVSAADGSAALTNLEVVLRLNTAATDGNDDYAIYMEWLSREGESVDGADAAVTNILAPICGRDTDADGTADPIEIDSRLDVYCLRFRL